MSQITTRKRHRNGKAADDYLALVRAFPLRPIRSRDDYDRALQVLENLTAGADGDRASGHRAGEGLTARKSDYADVLARMVRDYDERHSSLLIERLRGRKPSPVDILKYLMREHDMNTVTLGKLVGGSGQASMILSGKRELSKANIRALAEYFHVSAALLI
jgi:HTH-type transcriptional regulator/antitoxin HigA